MIFIYNFLMEIGPKFVRKVFGRNEDSSNGSLVALERLLHRHDFPPFAENSKTKK
jgi:hypothetical protein